MDTVLIVDSCCDLPYEFIKSNDLDCIGLMYIFKGKEYTDDFGSSISYKEFYDAVRSGEMPTTSQINPYRYESEFEKFVKEGKSILSISFSSGLSGSFNSSVTAKQAVLEKYPDADITLVDSKCASGGYGMLVFYSYNMLKSGKSKEEIAEWAENNKLKINHWFTVEDLGHLKRGGRISGATAIIGTLLDIKPIMRVDDRGMLVPFSKVKGRKKSIKELAQKLKDRIVNPEEQTIFITHGDCLEEAEMLRDIILSKVKVKDCIISNVGTVIGAHSGPGTMALFFFGDSRN